MTTYIDALVRYRDGEELEITVGVMPEGFDPVTGNTDELPMAGFVHYWITRFEAERFGAGFTTEEWEVVTTDV